MNLRAGAKEKDVLETVIARLESLSGNCLTNLEAGLAAAGPAT